MKRAIRLAFLATLAVVAAPALATGQAGMASDEAVVQVGGGAMLPTKDIVDNAVNSADHTTLVAAVKAADLVQTLKGEGPLTVLAPTNDAFENLPAGTVASLLAPENKDQLTRILTYHVVPGRLDRVELWARVEEGGGEAHLKTVTGEALTVRRNGPANLVIVDGKGGVANISTYDVIQSNGVIHVIDRVLLP